MGQNVERDRNVIANAIAWLVADGADVPPSLVAQWKDATKRLVTP